MTFKQWALKHDPATRRAWLEKVARSKQHKFKENQTMFMYNGISKLGKLMWCLSQLLPLSHKRGILTAKNGDVMFSIVSFRQWFGIPFNI